MLKTEVLVPMYNLIECSDYYSKTSASLWQCYKEEAPLTNAVITMMVSAWSYKVEQLGLILT